MNHAGACGAPVAKSQGKQAMAALAKENGCAPETATHFLRAVALKQRHARSAEPRPDGREMQSLRLLRLLLLFLLGVLRRSGACLELLTS